MKRSKLELQWIYDIRKLAWFSFKRYWNFFFISSKRKTYFFNINLNASHYKSIRIIIIWQKPSLTNLGPLSTILGCASACLLLPSTKRPVGTMWTSLPLNAGSSFKLLRCGVRFSSFSASCSLRRISYVGWIIRCWIRVCHFGKLMWWLSVCLP